MNYETATDFDINKAVAEALGRNIADEQYLDYGDRDENIVLSPTMTDKNAGVDYCNNPSDAWPIILENRISIIFTDIPKIERAEKNYGSGYVQSVVARHRNENPLRAAMIVFLKMQGDKR